MCLFFLSPAVLIQLCLFLHHKRETSKFNSKDARPRPYLETGNQVLKSSLGWVLPDVQRGELVGGVQGEGRGSYSPQRAGLLFISIHPPELRSDSHAPALEAA